MPACSSFLRGAATGGAQGGALNMFQLFVVNKGGGRGQVELFQG